MIAHEQHEPEMDRERLWDVQAVDHLLLDIALALLERHRGEIDEIELDLVGYQALGLRNLHRIVVSARLSGHAVGTILKLRVGEQAEALFVRHEPDAKFLHNGTHGALVVARTGWIARDGVSAHRRMAALSRMDLC